MRQRNEKDIWQGLNDFYLIETNKRQKPEILLKNDKHLSQSFIVNESKVYRHVLSHQKLMVRFVTVRSALNKKTEKAIRKLGMNWFTKNQVEKIPKPILIERFIKEKIDDVDFW